MRGTQKCRETPRLEALLGKTGNKQRVQRVLKRAQKRLRRAQNAS
jgi:hypothetical protein